MSPFGVSTLIENTVQVCGENAEIQAALREATSARMTKEGEVAVLRRGIEKVRLALRATPTLPTLFCSPQRTIRLSSRS